ncbi:unnamed protein product [marine sediment metagenome]|uniref:Uncharacterized protein n=1 Tax=marine sediment metagenome TaxID=412755 RepID=X1TVB3_9ZZZZ
MPLPKEQLDLIKEDIDSATGALIGIKDVIDDMRLAGMSIEKQQTTYDDLSDKLRSLRVFYERQIAKSG